MIVSVFTVSGIVMALDDKLIKVYTDICPSSAIDSFGPNDGCVLIGKQKFFPTDLAIDSQNNIYTLFPFNSTVYKLSGDGTFITKWGSQGSTNGKFGYPSGIAADRFGNVFVSDYSTNRIQKFRNNGTFVTGWGSPGTGNGQFSDLQDVAVDPSGNVFALEHGMFGGTSRIQKFTNNGTFVTLWGSECRLDVPLPPHFQKNCVDPDGAGPMALGDGQFNGAKGVTTDPLGFVYVVDQNNHRIQKFTNNGTFVTKWGTPCDSIERNVITGLTCPNPQDGEILFPNGGIATDSLGFIYVVDQNNHRIQKFTNNGTFLTKWDYNVPEEIIPIDGITFETTGIAVSTTGEIYSILQNKWIQIFRQINWTNS